MGSKTENNLSRKVQHRDVWHGAKDDTYNRHTHTRTRGGMKPTNISTPLAMVAAWGMPSTSMMLSESEGEHCTEATTVKVELWKAEK